MPQVDPIGKIRPGLVSVSFRRLQPETITELCLEAGLEGIEWGGDVHVPHGNLDTARRVGELTRKSGLQVVCYGSYYRCGKAAGDNPDFSKVLDTARELGAPTVRVWLGGHGSADTTPEERADVIEDLARITGMAGERGLRVCGEKHGGTLTDTDASTVDVLEQIPDPDFAMLWQPTHGVSVEDNIQSLESYRARLEHLHVFHWWPASSDRLPLADGADRWAAYLRCASGAANWALLEFFKDDSTAQCVQDAAVLRRLLAVASAETS